MDNQLQVALKELSENASYDLVMEEFIIPEMRKLMLIDDTFDITLPDSDIKVEILARQKAYKVLETIFDTINRTRWSDVKITSNNEMI